MKSVPVRRGCPASPSTHVNYPSPGRLRACICLALGLAWLLVPLRVPGAPCVAPPSGLVSWWQAESNAVDRAGSNTGTLLYGATYAAGMVGTAFSFDGTNSEVQVPDAPSLRLTNELTIEFWVKRQDLQMDDYIIEKGGDWTRGA